MANISSYNQLSSWNEDDDLLFVQQPDAPKKAHPSQMKQYVEAGDFEATGEIEDGHGNKLSGVVDIIGDLSQTGLTGDSVAAQLDTAREQIAAVGDLLSGQYQPNENVPANSSKDYTISFGKTFSTPPIVVANIYGYLNPKIELMGPNICQVTKTDFTIRVYNSYSRPLSCKVNWLARG